MDENNTTIAAIATPNGIGGIGIVRISGPDARAVAAGVFAPAGKKMLESTPGYTALYGKVFDKDGPFDEAVALIFISPRSYTGEDVVELSCHGGLFIVRRLLTAVIAAGALPAGPGEFTRRAFLNGKLSLTEAEAVMDLIGAQGKRAAAAALAAKDGALGRKADQITRRLVDLLAHIAAWVDYPEEEIPALRPAQVSEILSEAVKELTVMTGQFDAGKVIREGVEAVIVGRPNVGKSTLMNLLSGSQRSIVTEIPGTTRDIVEDTVQLGGLILHLADTAGVRETDNPVESIGVERTLSRLKTAGFALAVFDASLPLEEQDKALIDRLSDIKAVAVINKTDLPPLIDKAYIRSRFSHVVSVCASSGEGVEELTAAAEDLLGTGEIDPSAGILATERQKSCALRALQAVKDALKAVNGGVTLDAVSVVLDDAVTALLELSGKQVTETVLDEVFSRFCVGK